jgi:hypothetical protein
MSLSHTARPTQLAGNARQVFLSPFTARVAHFLTFSSALTPFAAVLIMGDEAACRAATLFSSLIRSLIRWLS